MARPSSQRVAANAGPPRPRASRRRCPSVERLEARVVLDATLGDIAMLAATTTDSRSITFRYEVTLPEPAPAGLTARFAFYRSSDPVFSPGSDVPIDSLMVPLTQGTHAVTAPTPTPLAIDPSHPFVLAVADPLGTIAETNEDNNTASFRIFVIGAVSHGFELSPGDSAWVDVMAGSLEQDGYDVGIAFHWDDISSLPIPGMTNLAGAELAGDVVKAVASLAPKVHEGDVIALHMIGHSRGSVVISQAGLDLGSLERLVPGLAPLKAGPLKLTFLDPHPASNTFSGGLYSAAPTLVGQIGVGVYTWVQSKMQDPNVVVPATADWAEVYYQRTSYQKAQNFIESNFLLWGEGPGDIRVLSPSTVVTSLNLTNTVPGHYLVHDWYQNNVIPTLGSPPGSGSSVMTTLAALPAAEPSTAVPLTAAAVVSTPPVWSWSPFSLDLVRRRQARPAG